MSVRKQERHEFETRLGDQKVKINKGKLNRKNKETLFSPKMNINREKREEINKLKFLIGEVKMKV